MGALDHVKLRLIESLSDAEDFMRWLGERREILGVDTETGGLVWWKEPLRLVQLGDADAGWAIPWQLWGGVAKEALEKYEGDVVMHNAAFDLRFLEENGVDVRDLRTRTHDTSVMAHLLDSTRLRGLKILSKKLVDPNAVAGEDLLHDAMKAHKWTWGTVPIDLPSYWAYGALDPVLACRLFSRMKPEIDAGFTEVYEMEMALLHVLSAMQRRGMLVDVEYTEKTRDALEIEESEIREAVKAEYGISASSNDAVAQRLLEDNMPLTKQTKGGKFSVDEEVLSGLQNHPLAAKVLRLRQCRKFRRSYFEAILAGMHEGRVRPSINPLGARTGRMSVSTPPFQQLPSGSPLVRDCVVAGPGNKLLSVDYDQIEWRVFAHYAQEPTMLQAIRDGEDLHWANARMIYGPTEDPAHRKASKTIGFAKLYGAGVDKLASQLGCSKTEALALIARFDAALPGIAQMGREVDRVVMQRERSEGRGYVNTFAGRRSYVDKGKSYTGLNYICQGSAADILKRQIVELDKHGLADYALLPVHDEVIFEVPEADASELLREIEAAMTDGENFAVPITASGEIISRWGDPYHKEEPA